MKYAIEESADRTIKYTIGESADQARIKIVLVDQFVIELPPTDAYKFAHRIIDHSLAMVSRLLCDEPL